MKSSVGLIPVKRVLKMINDCQDQEQIYNCRTIISNYMKSAKKRGLANINDLHDRLEEEILQRQEELYLSKIFKI